MRKIFHFFRQDAITVSVFFDNMRKAFHFFLIKCEKCFNVFDRMRKAEKMRNLSFLQDPKTISYFFTCIQIF